MVTADPPAGGRYVVARYFELQFHLHASPAYLSSHKPIKDLKDLAHHVFIDYVQDRVTSEKLHYLNQFTEKPLRVFTSTSILAQREAIAAGMGLGLLVPYLVPGRKDLVRLLPDTPSLKRTCWLAAPEDLFRQRRVRVVWDFLREIVKEEPALFAFSNAR